MIEKIANLPLEEQKMIICRLLWEKIWSLLSRIDCDPAHNTSEVLDLEECPLDMPEQLAQEFYEFVKALLIEMEGPDARLEKLTDSWPKYMGWAIRYKDDAGFACADAKRRTLVERIAQTNHKDILLYKEAQLKLAEYMLRALAKDFLEDAVGDDTFLPM